MKLRFRNDNGWCEHKKSVSKQKYAFARRGKKTTCDMKTPLT